MFCFCFPSKLNQNKKDKHPEPLKFRLLKAINLLQPILQTFGLPKKKQKYNIPKNHLLYLHHLNTPNRTLIPIVHFPAPNPRTSILILYCHGAGSNLNTVYALGTHFRVKFSTGFAGFDAMGAGESQGQNDKEEETMKIMLSWAVSEGYDLRRVVLCGFSVGTFSALILPGMMPRVLISPFSGIIPLVEEQEARFEGEPLDNIENAEKIRARVLLIHGRKQMIPVFHAHTIMDTLLENNDHREIELYEVEGYEHKNMPNFVVNDDGKSIMYEFLKKVLADSLRKEFDEETKKLLKQLEQINFHNLVRPALTNDDKEEKRTQ